jgi:soluble lytic murein transglycosylase
MEECLGCAHQTRSVRGDHRWLPTLVFAGCLVAALAVLAGCARSEAPPNLAGSAAGASSAQERSAAAEPGAAFAPAEPAASLPAPSAAAEALAQARGLLLDGDYGRASRDLAAIQISYAGTPEAAEALLRQGEALLADDSFDAAIVYLRRFLETYPQHPYRALASLMLGRALEARGDGGGAVAAYRQYEDWAEPGASLADLLHLRAANAYFGAGRAAEGWTELGLAAAAADRIPSAVGRFRVYDTLGSRYAEAGDRERAVAAWAVAVNASIAARRPHRAIAETAWKMVGAYQAMGQRDAADAWRWRIIGEWPRTAAAIQAATDVGPANVPALQRGIIAFANGRWQTVVDVLTPYLNGGAPDGQADLARYYRAIALLRLGDPGALAALDRVVEVHAESPWAAEALWEAGSLLLRQGDRPGAAARFERLGVGYPMSIRRSQALYWLGKLLPELGDAAAGRRYLEAAATPGREDFYTFRARAALQRRAAVPKPLAPQRQITADERAAFEQWAHGRLAYTPEAQAERRAQLEGDARFRRGTALLEAGFRREAEEEFHELLDAYGNDPVAVAHVAVHVRERGLYPYSVTLGHQLLDRMTQLGQPSLLEAPRVVQKLVLPLAFLALVEPAARSKNMDPLLMLGLMKQESWFEPRAASSASARGLTQFIFDTARSVAAQLNWPNWTWDDMNRPTVSVPFGVHYLSTLTHEFRGNYHFALAGYNGGPGNVLRWAKGDWERDLDLFVEEITYVETRGYVKLVAGNYELYKVIYS